MTLREMVRIIGPRMMEVASRRWPGSPCTIYVLGLQDPLGRMIALTLQAMALAPRSLGRTARGRPLVMAGVTRTCDMVDLMRGLARADECFSIDGDGPLAPGASKLGSVLAEVTLQDVTAVLLVGSGEREVLLLEEDLSPWGLFGRADPIGQA